jgi:hypothetical protein
VRTGGGRLWSRGASIFFEAQKSTMTSSSFSGGEHGVSILEGRDGYWPSVWAVRGLLHVWDDDATTEAVRAMAHSSWRVREMAAKVVARRERR